jgi:membrane-associated phospholipid phosphatase
MFIMSENLNMVFNKVGENGPLILIFVNIFLMFKKMHFQFYYVLFALISAVLNTILKPLIKHPRPSIDKETFRAVLKRNERFIKRNGHPYDIFGMPSGHTQSVIYSTVYNYLVFRENQMTVCFLVISLLTMFQRVVYNHHTVLQVIVGGIIGIMIAYVAYYFAKHNVAGKFSIKPDDNCFL